MNVQGTPSAAVEIKTTTSSPSGLAQFNGKKWQVVIAAQQYRGARLISRGFGDITTGVRLLNHLKERLTTADCSFVLGHYAENQEELARLKKITDHADVKKYILCGHKDNPIDDITPEQMNWEHQTAEVIDLLDRADLIVHAPSSFIAPVGNSLEKYSSKLLAISEYESRDNHGHEETTPIKTLNMGFHKNRLYLEDVKSDATDFNDPVLANHCLNPNADSSKAGKRQPFYFAYGHTHLFVAQMLRLMLLVEGGDEREVVLVTTFHYDPWLIEKYSEELEEGWCPYGVIRLRWFGTNDSRPKEHDFLTGSDERPEKLVKVITPEYLNNSDFLLLQKGSILNYSSGDISTSDVIALGKIPILDPSTKPRLFQGFHEKMKTFCAIPGNEEYVPLFNTWIDSAGIFGTSKDFSQKHSDLRFEALQQLNSPQWQRFEHVFTDWLKQNNETDTVISREISAILEAAEPLQPPEGYPDRQTRQ